MEMKHAEYDLAQMKSLPLDAKIRMTDQRLRSFIEACEYKVSAIETKCDIRDMVLKELIDDIGYELENGENIINSEEITEEGAANYNDWLKYGCNQYGQLISRSFPMAFWTLNDVLEYIVKYDIPHDRYKIMCADINGNIIKEDDIKDILSNPFETVNFSLERV